MEYSEPILFELSGELLKVPAKDRGDVFRSALSFSEYARLSHCASVSAIRLLLVKLWFERFQKPIPRASLQDLLYAPTAIGLAQRFSLLNHASKDELSESIENVVSELHKFTSILERIEQLSLFPDQLDIGQGQNDKSNRCVASQWANSCVSDLGTLIRSGARFATVYADPPWPYRNYSSRAAIENHYSTMSLDEIKSEPVSKLVKDDAHLHLRTTNALLRDSFEVMEAWGFEFKSRLIWKKPKIGMGNYWRLSHEFSCLGVRGNPTFADRTQRSLVLADRSIHSRKPREVRDLVERVSRPPFLEMYGREAFPGSAWTVYGNQIEQLLF